MKKLPIKESLQLFADEVHNRLMHYEQRLKWHDEEFNENANEHATMTTLIIGSFVIHILTIIYLIIKGI